MFAAAAGSPNLMLQATIFLGAALLFVPLGKRFGIATVLGYLITGLILGPSGLDGPSLARNSFPSPGLSGRGIRTMCSSYARSSIG